MKKIYVCGPIRDAHEGVAKQWRTMALAHLDEPFRVPYRE